MCPHSDNSIRIQPACGQKQACTERIAHGVWRAPCASTRAY